MLAVSCCNAHFLPNQIKKTNAEDFAKWPWQDLHCKTSALYSDLKYKLYIPDFYHNILEKTAVNRESRLVQ